MLVALLPGLGALEVLPLLQSDARAEPRDVARFTRVDHSERVALVILLQGEMIAVGRFETIEDGEAEVAFLVEDRHQGRGIAQVLLEHLAAAGRERGLDRFTAEVLPDNHRMIQTFRDAGYHVASGYDDGVLTLEFPIDATDTSIGVMRGREQRAEAVSIERFVDPPRSPSSARADGRTPSARPWVRNLVTGDFTGRENVVNPSAGAVSGSGPTGTVGDIPDEVDVADRRCTGRRGQRGRPRLRRQGCARPRRRSPPASPRPARRAAAARSPGGALTVLRPAADLNPNRLGIINPPAVSVNASSSSVRPLAGAPGLLPASAGLCDPREGERRGLGPSTFASVPVTAPTSPATPPPAPGGGRGD